MLKAEISKEANKGIVHAEGNVPEVLNDVAILLSSIYRQLQSANPALAQAFRYGVTGLVNDPNSPAWSGMGDQIGYAVRKN